MTTWAEWKMRHPHTALLKKNEGVYASGYARYAADESRLGRFGTKNPDERLGGKEMIYGVKLPGGKTVAVTEARLEEKGGLVARVGRSGVLLTGAIPIPRDTEVGVVLRSPTGDLVLEATGRVVRVRDSLDADEVEVAVAFGELEPAVQSVLEQMISRVVQGIVPAVLDALPAEATAEQIRHALAQVPVAHRMQLATRGVPREREILQHDSNPHVLDALLRNPNLNLPEVQRILRLPILLPSTLELLSRSSWGKNEELRLSIATHVNATLALADRLIAALGPDAKRKALQRPGLHPAVRAKLIQKH